MYGAGKIWGHLNHTDGIGVRCCRVEWLMREMGLGGCRWGRTWVRTTEGDETLERPADLVDRQFRVLAPNRLWVADITSVKTHSGWVHVAFIVDVRSGMVVGWQASKSLRSDLAIDAVQMAIWNRRRAGADLSQLTHHSDRGVQYLSIRYTARLDADEIVASVGPWVCTRGPTRVAHLPIPAPPEVMVSATPTDPRRSIVGPAPFSGRGWWPSARSRGSVPAGW